MKLSTISKSYFCSLLILNYSLGTYFFSGYFSEWMFHLAVFSINMPLFSLIVFQCVKREGVTFDILAKLTLFLVMFYLMLSAWLLNDADYGFGFILRGINPFIISIIIFYLCGKNDNTVFVFTRWLLYSITVILILEAITRYYFSIELGSYLSDEKVTQIINMQHSGEGSFYFLKLISFLRYDSNGVGVIAFLAFSLSLLARKLYLVGKFIPIALFIIICLTLSRAAIIVAIIYYVFSVKKKSIIYVFPTVGLAFMLMLPFFFYGESGSSKIEVIEGFFEYIKVSNIYDLSVGKGIASDIFSVENTGVQGFFGHNLIVFIVFYLGMLCLVPYLIFLSPFSMPNRYSILFYISLLLIGMSYLRPFEPFIFIIFPLVYFLSQRMMNEHSGNYSLYSYSQ